MYSDASAARDLIGRRRWIDRRRESPKKRAWNFFLKISVPYRSGRKRSKTVFCKMAKKPYPFKWVDVSKEETEARFA